MGTFAQCSLNLSSTTLKISRTFCDNFKPNYNITCSVGSREMKDVWKEWLLPDFTEGSFPDVTVIVSSNGVSSAVFNVDFSPVSGRWEWTSNVTVFLSTEKRKVTHLTTPSESRLDLTIDSTNVFHSVVKISVNNTSFQNYSLRHSYKMNWWYSWGSNHLLWNIYPDIFVVKDLTKTILGGRVWSLIFKCVSPLNFCKMLM